jgi:hypothetical protein
MILSDTNDIIPYLPNHIIEYIIDLAKLSIEVRLEISSKLKVVLLRYQLNISQHL